MPCNVFLQILLVTAPAIAIVVARIRNSPQQQPRQADPLVEALDKEAAATTAKYWSGQKD